MVRTIQQVADEVCEQMVYDEERKIFHQKKCGDPQWIQDMIHDCHYRGMLPDNYVFEWVYEFCREISELDEDDDPYEIEVISDTYTHDLLKWLSSNLARIDFVEDAFDEYFSCYDSCDLPLMIGLGQEKEMREVLYTIIDKLKDQIDLESENEEENS